MQDIFDPKTISELATRINQLDSSSQGLWGKMNVYEMLKHCTENERLMLRQTTLSRRLIGLFFGKMALKHNTKDDAPLDKNSPTHPDLKFGGEQGDVEEKKQLWISLLKQYPSKKTSDYIGFVHPFFGKMDRNQVARFVYKHIDHHLRQFGV